MTLAEGPLRLVFHLALERTHFFENLENGLALGSARKTELSTNEKVFSTRETVASTSKQ